MWTWPVVQIYSSRSIGLVISSLHKPKRAITHLLAIQRSQGSSLACHLELAASTIVITGRLYTIGSIALKRNYAVIRHDCFDLVFV
jgi:hypothetical protein